MARTPDLPPRPGDSFVVTSLEGRRGLSTRAFWLLVTLGVAMVVVIAGTLGLLRVIPDGASPAASGTATSTPPRFTELPTYTPTPTTPLPSGWSLGGPQLSPPPPGAIVDEIAYAPSQPNTLYSCGATDAGVGFSKSTDGGATWSQPSTILTDVQNSQTNLCVLAVSPTQANDIAVLGAYCRVTGCSGSLNNTWGMARSRDGGATWHDQSPPGTDAASSSFSGLMAWAGTTLLCGVTDPNSAHQLAVSVNGGSFTFIGNINPPAGTAYAVSYLNALGTDLIAGIVYEGVTANQMLAPAAVPFVSADDGNAWNQLGLPNNDQFEDTTPDGQTLIAYDSVASRLLLTHDLTHWQATPALPVDSALELSDAFIQATPDGTVLAYYATSPNFASSVAQYGALYVLAAGSSKWASPLALTLTGPRDSWNITPIAVVPDSQGRPATLWGYASEANNFAPQLVVYHFPGH